MLFSAATKRSEDEVQNSRAPRGLPLCISADKRGVGRDERWRRAGNLTTENHPFLDNRAEILVNQKPLTHSGGLVSNLEYSNVIDLARMFSFLGVFILDSL